jgi:hypothetical protein
VVKGSVENTVVPGDLIVCITVRDLDWTLYTGKICIVFEIKQYNELWYNIGDPLTLKRLGDYRAERFECLK